MPEYILETMDLSKRYRKKMALDQVSLRLEAGHIYGLVGNNGSGKSTLLRIITGLSKPTSGGIKLFGCENKRELNNARKRLGALVEAPAYYADMTIGQNLYMQALLCENKVTKNDIISLRKKLGIDAREIGELRLSQCSMGQKQRYGIAAAVLGDPELLILDEPLNGLDPSGVRELREFLKLINQKGVTILISSHLLAELYKLATDYIF